MALRFRHRQQSSTVPEVNLVPMLDVLMSVLTFFVVVSMSFTGQRILRVTLPEGAIAPDQTPATVRARGLLVAIDQDGQLLVNRQPTDSAALLQQAQDFLANDPDGLIILQADRALPYDRIATLLTDLRDIGGDRVALAVQ